MRIGETKDTTSRPAGVTPRDANRPPAPEASRALVALEPATGTHRQPSDHRQAAFLAQLIAAKNQLPQARERRRAEPTDALAAYRTAAALTHQ